MTRTVKLIHVSVLIKYSQFISENKSAINFIGVTPSGSIFLVNCLPIN